MTDMCDKLSIVDFIEIEPVDSETENLDAFLDTISACINLTGMKGYQVSKNLSKFDKYVNTLTTERQRLLASSINSKIYQEFYGKKKNKNFKKVKTLQ